MGTQPERRRRWVKYSRQIDSDKLPSLEEIRALTQAAEQKPLEELSIQAVERLQQALIPVRISTRKAQAWFDAECYARRKLVLEALHKARTERTPDNLGTYSSERRSYKRLLLEKKTTYLERERERERGN